ncbi:MAG: secretin N-terminal domain-containing protein [Gammaproteobacteria bacterium]
MIKKRWNYTVILLAWLMLGYAMPRDPFTMAAQEPNTAVTSIEAKLNEQSLQQLKNFNYNLDLNFHHMPLKTLLEAWGGYKELNIVLSPSIKGEVTLTLRQVSAQEALTTILMLFKLSQYQHGTIVFIGPESEIQHLQQQASHQQALKDKSFPLSFAKAETVATLLQNKSSEMLSARGKLLVDSRNNAIWIQDTDEQLKQIQKFLQAIDIPAQQILIRAKIVNVDEDCARELGLKFGTDAQAGSQQNNESSADFEETGHVKIALAKLSANTVLSLELSALEHQGKAKIISSPELMASSRETAVIESGQEIPYQETTSSGATSITFKKAVLSLNVTPAVALHHQIALDLTVNQDSVSTLSVNGVPSITTQKVATHILVNDGETIVLGGIYEENNNHTLERVPFWNRLPLLGRLFANERNSGSRKELLIFVTPKIL